MLNSLAQYLLPTLVAMLFAYLMVRAFLNNDVKKRKLDYLKEQGETGLRLRLQAYERMVLFLERIHPLQLSSQLYRNGMTVAQLQTAIIHQVNTEYNHNITQQVYADRDSWTKLRNAKEDTLNFIIECASQKNPDTDGKALVQEVAAQLSKRDGMLPSQDAALFIQGQASRILNPS